MLGDPARQDIYGVGTKLPARFGKPFRVTTNGQNTQANRRFLRDTNPTALQTMEPSEFALEGLEPKVITYRTEQEQQQGLEKLIRRLIDEHDLLPAQIALLSPFRREHICLSTIDRLAGLKLVECGRRYAVKDRNCVYYDTIKSFKGLEAPCVIVHDLGVRFDPDNLASLYVAFSCGRFGLYVFGRLVQYCRTRGCTRQASQGFPVQWFLPARRTHGDRLPTVTASLTPLKNFVPAFALMFAAPMCLLRNSACPRCPSRGRRNDDPR